MRQSIILPLIIPCVLFLNCAQALSFAQTEPAASSDILNAIYSREYGRPLEDLLKEFIADPNKRYSAAKPSNVSGGWPSDEPADASVTTAVIKAADTPPKEARPPEHALKYCRDDQLGVRLLCSADWSMQEGKDMITLIVGAAPSVLVTITRIESNVKFLGQINSSVLESVGQYSDGFDVENAEINGLNAVKVKAFSGQYPDMRLLDYYFVHDKQLYGLLFSVTPKEEWDSYKFLFKKIADSFEFVEKQ